MTTTQIEMQIAQFKKLLETEKSPVVIESYNGIIANLQGILDKKNA